MESKRWRKETANLFLTWNQREAFTLNHQWERRVLESGKELFLHVVLRMWSEQVQLVLLWLPTSSRRIVIISPLEFLACQNGYLGNYFEGESGQMHKHKVSEWLAWGFECIFKALLHQQQKNASLQEALTRKYFVMGIILVYNDWYAV